MYFIGSTACLYVACYFYLGWAGAPIGQGCSKEKQPPIVRQTLTNVTFKRARNPGIGKEKRVSARE
jgi:hypothetical protein